MKEHAVGRRCGRAGDVDNQEGRQLGLDKIRENQ
jgi:hypothetical protein